MVKVREFSPLSPSFTPVEVALKVFQIVTFELDFSNCVSSASLCSSYVFVLSVTV